MLLFGLNFLSEFSSFKEIASLSLDFFFFHKLLTRYVLTRYVEQLVASAEAAVEEVIRRGVSILVFIFCCQLSWFEI